MNARVTEIYVKGDQRNKKLKTGHEKLSENLSNWMRFTIDSISIQVEKETENARAKHSNECNERIRMFSLKGH